MKITTKKEVKLVPELRFKEFYGTWPQMRLGDKCIIKGRIGYRGYTVQDIVPKGEGAIALSPSNINDGSLSFGKSTYISWFKYDESPEIKVQLNDILLVKTGSTYGKSAFVSNVPEPATINPQIVLLKEIKMAPDFMGYLIYHNIVQKQIQRTVVGGAIPTLSQESISNFVIPEPSLPEQQKIASFLSAVDEKINQLNQKANLLTQYKKGVMQKLFSQELRFKIKNEAGELVEPPEWEEKKLGEVGHTFNGLTGKTKVDFGLGKPYIQYTQIFKKSKIDITDCGLVDVKPNENQTLLKKGDVFFTTSSETPKEIGTSSVLLDEVKEVYLNSFCFGYRPSDVLSANFAQFLFRSNNFRRKIIPLAQGSTRYNMSKVQLLKLIINLPSLKEQKKIANYLTELDIKLEQVNTQIEKAKAFKKGLLQQMFV